MLPKAIFFIGVGLLAGTLFNDKQVGGFCGALLTNPCACLSGTWFDLDLVGGVFKQIAEVLPFYHAVEATKAVFASNYAGVSPHFWLVIGYGVVFLILAVVVFWKKVGTQLCKKQSNTFTYNEWN